jgi:hypothetical protein
MASVHKEHDRLFRAWEDAGYPHSAREYSGDIHFIVFSGHDYKLYGEDKQHIVSIMVPNKKG